jgi:pyruvate dehydrogenase E1 component beta subunit
MNLIGAINHTLDYEMGRDESVVVFGEDVGLEGGVFRATVGLQEKYGAKRCFDTPIAEAMVSSR